MRILVVSHEWERARPGGAQRSATALASGLATAGHDVTLASAVPAPGPLGEDDSTLLREVLVVSATEGATFSWAEAAHGGNWAQLLTELQPDVVHLHHYYRVGIELPLLIKRLLPRAAVVMTLHEYLAICLMSGQMVDKQGHLCLGSSPGACARCVSWPVEQTFAREDYVRKGLSHVDGFVTPSGFARDRYAAWGLPTGRIHVVPNAVDLPRRVEPRPPRAAEAGVRLAYLGQHTPHKGVEVLLDAVAHVVETNAEALAAVTVFGGGSEQFGDDFASRLRQARDQAPAVVSFPGPYRQDDLVGILDEVDAIVVPSVWWENSPVVIEEALARRVPVICSDIGGMAEKVRDGVDGWHFPVGNAEALARLILRLASSQWEFPEMRQPMPLDEVVTAHLRIYEEAGAGRVTDTSS